MKCETRIERKDGTIIRLVSDGIFNVFTGKLDCNCYALVKFPGSNEENLFTSANDPDKTLKGLSVDEYIKRGRKGLISMVRPHEILKSTSTLLKMLMKKE